jgi:hypothetical protein
MYHSLTPEIWKQHLQLPPDYHVDGMLIFGTYDSPKQRTYLQEVLESLNLKYSVHEFADPFLQRMVEVRVGDKVIWFDVSYGGPRMCEYLHWACLFGSQTNILLGSCGGLSKDLAALDVIIPNQTYGNESTTRMYHDTPDCLHASDKKLSERLQQNLQSQLTSQVVMGPTITCAAMLAETLEDVQRWSQEGYVGVEMEAATVFAVSDQRRTFTQPSLRTNQA